MHQKEKERKKKRHLDDLFGLKINTEHNRRGEKARKREKEKKRTKERKKKKKQRKTRQF